MITSANVKYIRISSSDKDPNQSINNGDFYVEMKEKFLTQSCTSVLAHQAFVPNVFYNIRSTQGVINNTIDFTELGQPATSATIAEGQYTIATLIPAIQTAVDAQLVATTLSLAQDPITKKLIFTFTGNTVIIDATSSMASAIGLSITTPSQLVSVMDYIPDLRGYPALYIHSNTISPGNLIDGNAGMVSALVCVPFTGVEFGQMAYYQSSDEEVGIIQYNRPQNLSLIHIVLRDSEGNRLDPGTSEIVVIMRCSFV